MSRSEAFNEAFGVGAPGADLHPIDVGGVAFASLQALYALWKEKRALLEQLEGEVNLLTSRVERLEGQRI